MAFYILYEKPTATPLFVMGDFGPRVVYDFLLKKARPIYLGLPDGPTKCFIHYSNEPLVEVTEHDLAHAARGCFSRDIYNLIMALDSLLKDLNFKFRIPHDALTPARWVLIDNLATEVSDTISTQFDYFQAFLTALAEAGQWVDYFLLIEAASNNKLASCMIATEDMYDYHHKYAMAPEEDAAIPEAIRFLLYKGKEEISEETKSQLRDVTQDQLDACSCQFELFKSRSVDKLEFAKVSNVSRSAGLVFQRPKGEKAYLDFGGAIVDKKSFIGDLFEAIEKLSDPTSCYTLSAAL